METCAHAGGVHPHIRGAARTTDMLRTATTMISSRKKNLKARKVARMASSNSEVAVGPGGAEQESLGEWALLTCGTGSEPMQEVYIADPEGKRLQE